MEEETRVRERGSRVPTSSSIYGQRENDTSCTYPRRRRGPQGVEKGREETSL